MVSIIYSGQLGNNLFQYIAAYLFAKKFNFQIISKIVENKFLLPSIKSYNNNNLNKVIYVDDKNFMTLLESETLELAHYVFTGYYQLKDFILNYKDEIKSLFTLNIIPQSLDSVFVSYRLGDIDGLRQALPIEYYEKALELTKYNSGFITTDSPNHNNIKYLIDKYGLTLYQNSPLETIDFGKNFNNLILSEGSFSWWIGFLSSADNVYFNKRPRFWHGDMFVIPEWNCLKYDWASECIGNNNILKCDKVIFTN